MTDDGRGYVWSLVPGEGTPVIDTGVARWWIEDGVLCSQNYADATITADHVRAGFSAARRLSCARVAPLIAEGAHQTLATREARELVSGPEAAAHYAAMAVVAQSPVARMLMKFFTRLTAPPFPVAVFATADEARRWARGHRSTRESSP
jgi:hypothetical protein